MSIGQRGVTLLEEHKYPANNVLYSPLDAAQCSTAVRYALMDMCECFYLFEDKNDPFMCARGTMYIMKHKKRCENFR